MKKYKKIDFWGIILLLFFTILFFSLPNAPITDYLEGFAFSVLSIWHITSIIIHLFLKKSIKLNPIRKRHDITILVYLLLYIVFVILVESGFKVEDSFGAFLFLSFFFMYPYLTIQYILICYYEVFEPSSKK